MYKGIEGLRAWLAWTVVLSHMATVIVPVSMLPMFGVAAEAAVKVFIIISGFVITHLILGKKERFRLYISRRFLRIYPAYLVALLFSILIANLSYRAILEFPGMPASMVQQSIVEQQQFNENFATHLWAHLSLFHGALPNSVLPQSEYMFLGPAWSLSLEWQFYFLAPIWIWALRRFPLLTVGSCLLAAVSYKLFLSGAFFNPSFLPGSCLLFLLGMSTRFWLPSAPRLKEYPFAAVLGFFGVSIIDRQLIIIPIWIAIVAYLMQDGKWGALDGPAARAAGMRSYAVYIIHEPILFIALFVTSNQLHLSGPMFVISFVAASIIGTLVLSEAIHRWIEMPAIDYAKTLGRPSLAGQMRPIE